MSYEVDIHEAMKAGVAAVLETYGLERATPPRASERPPAPAPDLFCAMLHYTAPLLRGVVVIVGPATSGSPQQSECYELPVGAEVLDVWGDVLLEPGFAPGTPERATDAGAGELIVF